VVFKGVVLKDVVIRDVVLRAFNVFHDVPLLECDPDVFQDVPRSAESRLFSRVFRG